MKTLCTPDASFHICLQTRAENSRSKGSHGFPDISEALGGHRHVPDEQAYVYFSIIRKLFIDVTVRQAPEKG